MPRPLNERKSLEAELPGLIAGYVDALAKTPLQDKTRRDMLDWQARNAQKQLADIRARLTRLEQEG